MTSHSVLVTMTVLLPFAVVGGLLWLAAVTRARRAAAIVRQIAVTDAIHRELGAAAAPVVGWSWTGAWIVSVALPLHREALVGAVTRIIHEVFERLDAPGRTQLRLVLIPREVRPWDRVRMTGPARAATRLGRAA